MYRVSCITQQGIIKGKNCDTIEECYEFLFSVDYKKYRIKNRDTGKIIEKEENK